LSIRLANGGHRPPAGGVEKNSARQYPLTVRIFKNTWFSRFAQREGITDDELKNIVSDLEKGVWDADLGGGVYKKRIARSGAGKAGGYRTIVLFKSGQRAFFVYGFAKSKRRNIEGWELKHYKENAKDRFALTEDDIKPLLEKGSLIEIL
jgi:hypothetical protein